MSDTWGWFPAPATGKNPFNIGIYLSDNSSITTSDALLHQRANIAVTNTGDTFSDASLSIT